MAAFPELENLNAVQRQAVLHDSGSLLILAGAGSGKTRVITVKIAYLIRELGVSPFEILAVTFTNKAAAEMRERAAALTPAAESVMIRTFHSFGAWMLRRNAAAAALSSSFSIYDDDDVHSLLRTLYPDEQAATLNRYARQISRAKDYALRPGDDLSPVTPDPELDDVYARYQSRLEEIGNADFGELILRPVELLRNESAIRERMHQRYRYILVDEYQDSNVAQHCLLRELSSDGAYVCVVGDDDQSIYRFRGAEVKNILTFSDSFPSTTVVKLEQNYRSTAPILDIASAVVQNNDGRLGKTLWTEREGGKTPQLALLRSEDEEVAFALSLVRSEPGETAILYRTNAQSRVFESAFLREGIPYRIVGSLRFYEREEVKDALALLRLIANPRDEISFRRVVNKPARGIGAKGMELIAARITDAGGDLLLAAEAAIPALSKKAGSGLRRFLDTLGSAKSSLGSGRLSEFAERLVRECGLWDHHKSHKDEVIAKGKVENLEELTNAASLYTATEEDLAEFLELVELDRAREENPDLDAQITLITMHNTKGLEFDRVMITGLEEGLFPRGGEESVEDIEEERRLFYVAVTRARNELYLTSCSSRQIHGRRVDLIPSRFVGEIPRELVEIGHGRGFSSQSEQSEFPPGTGVYHDDYGTGTVVRSWYGGSELVVLVRFESGRSARFVPKYTPLERVQNEF